MKQSHFINEVRIVAIAIIAVLVFSPLVSVRAEDINLESTTPTDEVVVTDTETTPVEETSVTAGYHYGHDDEEDKHVNNGDHNSKGSIKFHVFLCSEGTTVSDANGVDAFGNFTAPSTCAPQSGILFGYIHEDKSDRSPVYLGLEDGSAFTVIGASDSNGILNLHGLTPTGRYDVAEVTADGHWATRGYTLKLFCYGDSTAADNYEMPFVTKNKTTHCVDYRSSVLIPCDCGSTPPGTTTPPVATTTPPVATTTPPSNGGGGSTDNGGGSGGGGSFSSGGGSGYVGGGSGFGGGQVLGASTGPDTCGVYIKHYIKYGVKNDFEDVIKLQLFLNTHEGNKLEYTGIYDLVTVAAVDAFQVKYSTEVLKPWYDINLLPTPTTPTQYVYKTTKRMINNLMCPSLNLPIPQLP